MICVLFAFSYCRSFFLEWRRNKTEKVPVWSRLGTLESTEVRVHTRRRLTSFIFVGVAGVADGGVLGRDQA